MSINTNPKQKGFVIDAERVYNPNYTPPTLEVALSIQGETIAPFGGIVVYTGLPKNGKTFFLAATIASYFIGELYTIKLRLPKNKPTIAYFDTETPLHSFYKNIELIKTFCKGTFKEDKFQAFRLRDLEPSKIIELIKSYIQHNKNCGCIVIDGLLDLVIDENSPNEAKAIDTLLKRIGNQYGVTVLTVLHTNRGGADTNGKLGSRMDKTSDSTLLIKKVKEQENVYELIGTLLRYAKKSLEPLQILRQNDSIVQVDVEKPFSKRTFKDWTVTEHRAIAAKVMYEKGNEYKEVIQGLREIEAVGETYAKNIVKVWIAEKIIVKKENHKYYYKPN